MQEDTGDSDADSGQADGLEVSVEERRKKLRPLLESLNQSCSTARNGWLFLLATVAYLFVTVISVTHRDLFFDTPVKLPLLGTDVPLSRFFLFAPIAVILLWFGVLLQHSALHDKLNIFNARVAASTKLAGRTRDDDLVDAIRMELSTYFFAQYIAGPGQFRVRRGFLLVTFWATLGLAPLVVLLWFQISFLPFHDESVTAWHQFYVVLGLVLFLFLTPMARGRWRRWGLTALVVCISSFISLLVATVPDSKIDALTRNWHWARAEVPLGIRPVERNNKAIRYAFWPTAYFFEGSVDYVTRRPTSLFSRNLIVPSVSVPKAKLGGENYQISLRDRDLRYAILDGAVLPEADFTAANVFGASFRKANLTRARFECAKRGVPPNLRSANAAKSEYKRPPLGFVDRPSKSSMRCTKLNFTAPEEIVGEESAVNGKDAGEHCAVLSEADFTEADLSSAWLRGVDARFATMREAIARGASFDHANLCEVDLYGADIAGSTFVSATLFGANLQTAKAELAAFKYADMTLAELPSSLVGASLESAELTLAHSSYGNWAGATLSGVILTGSRLIGVTWPADAEGPRNVSDVRLVAADGIILSSDQEALQVIPKKVTERVEQFELDGTPLGKELASRLKAVVGRMTPNVSSSAPNEGYDIVEFDNRGQWSKLIKTWEREADDNFLPIYDKFVASLACARAEVFDKLVRKYGRDSSYSWGGGVATASQKVMEDARDSGQAEALFSSLDWNWGWGYAGSFGPDPLGSEDFRIRTGWLARLKDPACGTALTLKRRNPVRWCQLEQVLLDGISSIDEEIRGVVPASDPGCGSKLRE
jgi:uncharacterized protein YjbI with pentapeptide repeats